MQAKPMLTLDTVAALRQLLDICGEIKLYGAGYYLNVVLDELAGWNREYFRKIKCILVSDTQGNPPKVRGIPVMAYREAEIGSGDYVLLTLGHRYADAVYRLLKDTEACIVQIDFNMFQEEAYQEVKKSIQPFIDDFPNKLSGLNGPVKDGGITAWTCWWQGEGHAPEIVRACLRSQRRNMPAGVRHVVITGDNYRNYISLPGHITEKVKTGSITLTTLSDIIRASLLYKYGGFWMDATLFVCRPLPRKILGYPLYTRNLPETQYCADAMWSGWFFYAKPGNKLFAFLMESFFYYFLSHDKIRYYFMVDYVIAIACNTFPEVKKQLKAIPYNNEGAQELLKHLLEPYERQRMEDYIKNTSIQKLTYKLGQREDSEMEGTVYDHIIQTEINGQR